MTRIAIVTDSTCDLPLHLREEWGITVLPCGLIFGQEEYRNGEDLSPQAFYQKMRASNIPPTTTQPPLGLFLETYRRLVEEGHTVISIHISSLLSGIVRTAQMAAATFPPGTIYVIDSRQLSMGLGWQALYAARAAREGMSPTEIVQMIQAMIPRVRAIAMLETLEYVARGGRVGKAKVLASALLNVKPLVQVLDGEVQPIENVRTRRRALRRLVEILVQQGPLEAVAVLDADAPAEGDTVAEMLAARVSSLEILRAQAWGAITTHLGPGAVGICAVLAQSEKN